MGQGLNEKTVWFDLDLLLFIQHWHNVINCLCSKVPNSFWLCSIFHCLCSFFIRPHLTEHRLVGNKANKNHDTLRNETLKNISYKFTNLTERLWKTLATNIKVGEWVGGNQEWSMIHRREGRQMLSPVPVTADSCVLKFSLTDLEYIKINNCLIVLLIIC